ncbi:MAG: hypothetical protein E6959_10340 [Eikenella corrodens]|nr:hypothetical protein [Eikenella corrodens]
MAGLKPAVNFQVACIPSRLPENIYSRLPESANGFSGSLLLHRLPETSHYNTY